MVVYLGRIQDELGVLRFIRSPGVEGSCLDPNGCPWRASTMTGKGLGYYSGLSSAVQEAANLSWPAEEAVVDSAWRLAVSRSAQKRPFHRGVPCPTPLAGTRSSGSSRH